MYKAIILPLAKLDISEATAWYQSKQKGLGNRFTQEVRSKVLYLRENPEASALRYDDTRCAVLDVFPFMIHYTIDDAQKIVIIAALLHTSLSPKHWSKR